MDGFDFALLIPLFALSIPMIAIWTRHRTKIAEMEIKAKAELSAENAAQYASQTRDLEERVRVLERIVTDKGFDTAVQIEALRRDSATLEDRTAR